MTQPPVPRDPAQACEWLMFYAVACGAPSEGEEAKQRHMPALKRAWAAVAYLFPGFHPDDVADDYFLTQGNPCIGSLCNDALKAYSRGALTSDEYYNNHANRAGQCLPPPEDNT